MAYWVESAPHALAVAPRPRGGDWLEVDAQALRREGVDTLVSLLTPAEDAELGLQHEQEICERAGVALRRFPIQDRHVPSSERDFAAFVGSLYAEMLGAPELPLIAERALGGRHS